MKTTIKSTTMLLAGAAAMQSASIMTAEAAEQKQTNVIFILADDLGWSDVEYINGSKDFYETPNINRISQDGVRLMNFYPGGANSAPSRTNLMTGMSNVRCKMYAPGAYSKGDLQYMRWSVPARKAGDALPFPSATEVDPSVICVPEILAPVGYRSARIGKWHLGKDTQGFDESSGDGIVEKQFYSDPDATNRITKASLKFIEENKDQPFFLYTAFFDVHSPFVAHPDIIAKYEKKWAEHGDKSRKFNPTYAAMIEQVDTAVKLIFEKLDELGLAEDTLVIFGSDNGGVGFITDNTPLRGSKGNLYEGGIRTPAFAVWRGKIAPNSECATPIHGTDLMPTVAELSGAALPTSQPVDGMSMIPTLMGKKNKAYENRAICFHYPLYLDGKEGKGWVGEKVLPVYGTDKMYWRGVPSSAIQKGGWKLISFYEYDTCELYYLPDDIGERNNLAETNPKKVAELKADLEAWLKDTKADIPSVKNPKFDPTYTKPSGNNGGNNGGNNKNNKKKK